MYELKKRSRTAELDARRFVRTCEQLGRGARRVLMSARRRDIDIAFDIWPTTKRFADGLSGTTIERLAALEIGVRWTFYLEEAIDDDVGAEPRGPAALRIREAR